jgi:hypothetical protein
MQCLHISKKPFPPLIMPPWLGFQSLLYKNGWNWQEETQDAKVLHCLPIMTLGHVLHTFISVTYSESKILPWHGHEERRKINNQLHGGEPFLRSIPLCSYSRISHNFMEPKGSLLCSQEPSTDLYPKPDQSSPHHSIPTLQDPFQYYQKKTNKWKSG